MKTYIKFCVRGAFLE